MDHQKFSTNRCRLLLWINFSCNEVYSARVDDHLDKLWVHNVVFGLGAKKEQSIVIFKYEKIKQIYVIKKTI